MRITVDSKKYLLALNRSPKFGPKRVSQVLSRLDNLREIYSFSPVQLRNKLGSELSSLVIEARQQADPDQEEGIVKRLKLAVVVLGEKDYPKLLSEIPDPPALLYVKGDLKVFDNHAVAVVGSRKCSAYGLQMTAKITTPLAQAGALIVSGLALGIDGCAHRAALNASGVTCGVLANGLDQIYPSSHEQLAQQIVSTGGAIVSEFPPGIPAYPGNFPTRNRIIAGLSKAVVIIEAALDSGALYTATAALDYNREVLALAGDVNRPQAAGCNRLIKMGAKLVTGAEDVMESLNLDLKVAEAKARKLLPKSEIEVKICDLLNQKQPLSVDEIIRSVKLPAADVGSAITLMEIKGLIRNLGAGNYVLES